MYQVHMVLFSQETVDKDKVTLWCSSLFSSAESPHFGHFEKFPSQMVSIHIAVKVLLTHHNDIF